MDLIQFARSLPEKRTDRDFIEHLKRVLALDELKNLSDKECQNAFDACQFLVDYLTLQKEFYGTEKPRSGPIVIEYSGPYIESILTSEVAREN